MSVTVRLALVGKKDQHIFKIVACTTRSKRNGKSLDVLGSYNPNIYPPVTIIDNVKLQNWIKNGAIVSVGLRKVLDIASKSLK